MRTPFRFLLLACILFAACSVGLAGDFTRGALGRTQWQISDGLCPGLGGGCSLDVPVAVGAATHLFVKGVDPHGDSASASTGVMTGAFTVGGSASEPSATIDVSTLAAGDAQVTLLDGAGAEVDHVTLHVVTPTSIVCGTIATGDVDWKMSGLVETDTITTPVTAASSGTETQVACRASDAHGAVLTVNAITWTATTGATLLHLHDDSGTPATAHGARIYFQGVTVGDVVVHVTLGSLTRDLTVHVVAS